MSEIDNQEVRILPVFDKSTLSQGLSEKLSSVSLEARYMEYDGMQDFMQSAVSDPEIATEFAEEGYDSNYGTDEEGFYDFGPRQKTIYEVLGELKGKGIDTRRADEVFREISRLVWVNIPKYYKISGESEKFKEPADYNPEKPYPKYFESEGKERNSE